MPSIENMDLNTYKCEHVLRRMAGAMQVAVAKYGDKQHPLGYLRYAVPCVTGSEYLNVGIGQKSEVKSLGVVLAFGILNNLPDKIKDSLVDLYNRYLFLIDPLRVSTLAAEQKEQLLSLWGSFDQRVKDGDLSSLLSQRLYLDMCREFHQDYDCLFSVGSSQEPQSKLQGYGVLISSTLAFLAIEAGINLEHGCSKDLVIKSYLYKANIILRNIEDNLTDVYVSPDALGKDMPLIKNLEQILNAVLERLGKEFASQSVLKKSVLVEKYKGVASELNGLSLDWENCDSLTEEGEVTRIMSAAVRCDDVVSLQPSFTQGNYDESIKLASRDNSLHQSQENILQDDTKVVDVDLSSYISGPTGDSLAIGPLSAQEGAVNHNSKEGHDACASADADSGRSSDIEMNSSSASDSEGSKNDIDEGIGALGKTFRAPCQNRAADWDEIEDNFLFDIHLYENGESYNTSNESIPRLCNMEQRFLPELGGQYNGAIDTAQGVIKEFFADNTNHLRKLNNTRNYCVIKIIPAAFLSVSFTVAGMILCFPAILHLVFTPALIAVAALFLAIGILSLMASVVIMYKVIKQRDKLGERFRIFRDTFARTVKDCMDIANLVSHDVDRREPAIYQELVLDIDNNLMVGVGIGAEGVFKTGKLKVLTQSMPALSLLLRLSPVVLHHLSCCRERLLGIAMKHCAAEAPETQGASQKDSKVDALSSLLLDLQRLDENMGKRFASFECQIKRELYKMRSSGDHDIAVRADVMRLMTVCAVRGAIDQRSSNASSDQERGMEMGAVLFDLYKIWANCRSADFVDKLLENDCVYDATIASGLVDVLVGDRLGHESNATASDIWNRCLFDHKLLEYQLPPSATLAETSLDCGALAAAEMQADIIRDILDEIVASVVSKQTFDTDLRQATSLVM